METNTSQVGEHIGTPWTFGVLPDMDGGLEMLVATASDRLQTALRN